MAAFHPKALSRNIPAVSAETEDTCDMVMNRTVFPSDEIFNSYDHGLSNANLMMQYGFMLEGNSHDILQWSIAEIDMFVQRRVSTADREECEEAEMVDSGRPSFQEEIDWRREIWKAVSEVEFDDIKDEVVGGIYNPSVEKGKGQAASLDSEEEEDDITSLSTLSDDRPARGTPKDLLCINADGQISQSLFLYLTFRRLPIELLPPYSHPTTNSSPEWATSSPSNSPGFVVQRILSVLRSLQSNGLVGEAIHPDVSDEQDDERSLILLSLRLPIQDIVALCLERIEGMWNHEVSVEGLGKILVSANPTRFR
jgi:hypothetical protein